MQEQLENVRYVISYKNGYVILPINKFARYFDINANYRIKKSGSSEPAMKDIDVVKQKVKLFYPTVNFKTQGKKLFAYVHDPIVQDRFILGKYTYYFSERGPNTFEIRRLSNTYNMNVIFSIQLKKSQDPTDLAVFEADL